MNEIFLRIVTFIHLLYLLFVIIVPFTNSTYLLSIYVIVIPFMVFHWLLNDNTCALTLLEKGIRAQLYGTQAKSEECFTASIIEPIYDVNKNYQTFSTWIYIITGILWLIAVYKLYSKYQTGEIKYLSDIFK